jgi:hypothetical protein
MSRWYHANMSEEPRPAASTDQHTYLLSVEEAEHQRPFDQTVNCELVHVRVDVRNAAMNNREEHAIWRDCPIKAPKPRITTVERPVPIPAVSMLRSWQRMHPNKKTVVGRRTLTLLKAAMNSGRS